MRFSLFQNDDTLGEIYETARFAGTFTAWGFPESAVRDRIERNGWGVTAISVTSAGGFTNVHNYTVSINAVCGMNKETIAEGIRGSLRDMGAVNVTCRWVASSGNCNGNPDLIGQSTIPQMPTVRGGQLATVNVPISFDDDPAAAKSGGFLDTLKGFDTTTLVLLGLAAVLVLKKL